MTRTKMAMAIFALALTSSSAIAGPCTNPWDRAADGSKCGGRASSERPGGK
jgi:hypothetical protein